MSDAILVSVDANGRATVTLNRPEIHNAFDDALIARLSETFESLGGRDDVRVVVVAANGKSFSAGADLGWMRRMANYSEAENRADAERLARLIHVLDSLPKPTVARVQGAAIGGGVGLVAACDVAVASEAASFALSEVRLGLIPAVISPYVIGAIGPRQARRYMLTAERFDAAEAKRIGLVHAAVPAAELDAAVDSVVAALLLGGPEAVRESKALARAVGGSPDEAMRADTARRIARLRASPEGKEGVSSFLEKRKPRWQAP
ncbi:MAG: enoyl-CoA hydratase/isomerase family protein [Alphaproteobacteria bacterium]